MSDSSGDPGGATDDGSSLVERARRRRALAIVGCALAAIAAGAGVLVVLGAMGRVSHDDYVAGELARIRAAGEPTTPEELARWRSAGVEAPDATSQWREALDKVFAHEPLFRREVRQFRDFRRPFSLDGHDPRQAFRTQLVAQVEEGLRDILALSARPGRVRLSTRFDDGSPTPHMGGLRLAARAFRYRAELAVAKRDEIRAVESLRGLAACAHALDESDGAPHDQARSMLRGWFLESVLRVSGHDALSPDSLDAIAGLVDELRPPSSRRALADERATNWIAVSRIQPAVGSLAEFDLGVDDARHAFERAAFLRNLSRAVEIADVPYWDAKDRMEAAENDVQRLEQAGAMRLPHGRVFVMHRFLETTRREQAVREIVRTGIRALAHRRRTGVWIRTIEELPWPAGQPLPIDPYNDKPLRIMETPDGLTAYSVGSDQVDDGGKDPTGDGKPDLVGVFRWVEGGKQ